MVTIVELGGVRPTIGEGVWLAPTAVLIGEVHVGDRANVWFGAVLRGDASRIVVGAGTSIQDNCVVHCAHELPTEIGADVVVGHGALLEGCVVEDGAVIGMGAIVLQPSAVTASGARSASSASIRSRASSGVAGRRPSRRSPARDAIVSSAS